MDLAAALGIHFAVNAILNGFLRLPKEHQLNRSNIYQWDEVVDQGLRAHFGDDRGVDYFIKHGATWTARRTRLRESYNYFYSPGGKIRIPIYYEHLKKAGDSVVANCAKHGITIPGWETEEYLKYFHPLPSWVPHPEHGVPDEFDLYAVNWKIATRAFGMGGFAENPVMREMHALFDHEVDAVLLNKATAEAKGLKDKDHVVVESQFGGKVEGEVRVTGLLHPEVVGFAGNFGHRAPLMGKEARRGLNYNQLLSAADGEFDPAIGAVDVSPAVKVIKG
jgi:anaerobic selenocysteine-containing dehydrogenase